MTTIQKTLRMFEFIKFCLAWNHEAPTIAELGREFNMRSPASVHAHLKTMEAKGWIRRTPNISRGIEIVEQENKAA